MSNNVVDVAVIFQEFDEKGRGQDGDGLRSELKGFDWPMPHKKEAETPESFLDRMAGYQFLLVFYPELFCAIANVLPRSANVNHSFNRQHSSALACDAREADVMGQGPHTDIQPKYGFRRFSAVFSLSNFLCYLSYMVNSCQNTKLMMEFEQRHFKNFQQQLKKTPSVSDPNKTLTAFLGGKSEDSLCFAWRVYVGQSEDLQMQLVYVGIQPLVVALFDTDSVHWGAPYPLNPADRLLEHFLKIHFR